MGGVIYLNAYTNISKELLSLFSKNKYFRVLLPLDIVFLFAGLVIILFDSILGINMGGFLYNLAYWIFILGLLLVYANRKEKLLYIGLLGYGAINLLNFMINLIGTGVFSWGLIFNAAIFGGLGYLVLRRSLVDQKD
jgi:hypothetical protein